MARKKTSISNPDELNKFLQHDSPFTWIILGAVSALLIAFFAWATIFKLKIKLSGDATIANGQATLVIKQIDLDKLSIGQSVYISDVEGEIIGFDDDNQPITSNFALDDGNYTYTVVLGEKRPIEFLIGK